MKCFKFHKKVVAAERNSPLNICLNLYKHNEDFPITDSILNKKQNNLFKSIFSNKNEYLEDLFTVIIKYCIKSQ